MRKLVGAVLFGGAAAAIVADWIGVGGSGVASAVNGPVYDAVVVAAGLACLLRARESRAERAAWLALGAAVLSWAAAEVYWTAYIEGNPSAPYPSPADIGYLAFYPLAVVGLYLLVRARAKELDPRLWMDGAIAALGTGALGAALIFEFVADHARGSSLEVLTTLAYPLGDIILLSLAVGVIALTRWRPGRTWSLLLAGLAAMAVADVAYTLQSYGGTLPAGAWIEPIYLASAVFVGAEAWQSETKMIEPDARFDGWRELVVPGIVAVTMIALVALQYFSHASALTTLLWSATMLAVLGRLVLSLRTNKALLEQVQTDRLTGLGSRARLEIDLEARCSRAAEEPVAVVLFDLNGFKRYNDRFGHPAGDEMLGQLGGRLRAAVAPEGFAYRTGGDEFVVLIDGVTDAVAVTRRAAAALSTRGYGYDISASWGLAEVPEEADAPSSALQLADVRMYAQKESRRLAGPLSLPDREAIEQSA